MLRKCSTWIAALTLGGCSSALGPQANTEEGFFFSGDTSLSYALDIPVVGTPPYPLVVFGHGSGPDTKNLFKKSARRLVARGVATFRFSKRGVGDSGGVYERGYADFELLAGATMITEIARFLAAEADAAAPPQPGPTSEPLGRNT